MLLPSAAVRAAADSTTTPQYILNLVLIYVIIGIGLNFLLGFAGQFAFAHAALMGIGAYTAALLTTRLGLSFWLRLPLSGVAAALIGAAGALPAMRMRRVYLAFVTFAVRAAVVWVLINWKSVTLGTDGVDRALADAFRLAGPGRQERVLRHPAGDRR